MIDEQIFEKYSQKVAYLKIDENILGNLSEILQNLNKAKKQKICFNILQSQQTENQPLRKSHFLKTEFLMFSFKRFNRENLVLEYYLQKDRIEAYDGEIEELEQLSETQKIALEEINKGFEEGKTFCFTVLQVL